jgi:hypothetical protein
MSVWKEVVWRGIPHLVYAVQRASAEREILPR